MRRIAGCFFSLLTLTATLNARGGSSSGNTPIPLTPVATATPPYPYATNAANVWYGASLTPDRSALNSGAQILVKKGRLGRTTTAPFKSTAFKNRNKKVVKRDKQP